MGFEIVYKGVIPGEDNEVALKKFSRDNMKKQDDFLTEFSIINRLRHKHLVRLLGELSFRFLICSLNVYFLPCLN